MVADARARLSLDAKPFTDTLKGAGDAVQKDFGKQLEGVGRQIKQAFTVGAIVAFGRQIIQTADEVDNMSKRLGISAETTQSLTIVAKEAGLSMEDFQNAILKVSKNSLDAQAGGEKMAAAFNVLGISIDDLKSMNAEELFEAVTVAMANNKNNAEVLNAAFDVMGEKAGPKLKSLLIELGEQGFGKLNEEMVKSGQIMSNEAISNWDKFGDQIAKASRQLQSFVGEYGSRFIDLLTKSGEAIGYWMAGVDADAVNDVFRESAHHVEMIRLQTEAANANLSEQVEIVGETAEAAKERAKQEEAFAKAQKDALAEQQRTFAQIDKNAAELLKSRDAYNRTLFESLSIEDKIKWVQFDQSEILSEINALETEGKKHTKEWYDAQVRLADATGDLADLTAKANEGNEKARDLSVEQVEKMRELRDVFKDMTDVETKKFLADMQNLANELRKIGGVDLGWITDLSRFKFQGPTSSQARQMADALATFVKEFERRQVNIPQGMKDLFELFGKLQGGPGTYKLDITVPKGWENGMILEPSFNATLKNIDTNLKTLAALKGVVWA